MKNKWMYGLLVASTLVIGACSNGGSAESSSEETTNEAATETIEDSNNNTVEVPQDPENVAVFDNGQLDNLDALGLGDKVVATATEDLPSHLGDYSDLPVAGTLHEVNLEVANAANPELAIVAGRSRSSFDGLSQFVPTVDFSNNTDNYFESIRTNMQRLGEIFNVQDEAQDIVTNLEDQMTQLNDKASSSDLNSLFLMYNEGSLSAYGPGSRFGIVHEEFGFEPSDPNIESSNHGMNVSYEYVLEQDPDILFVLDRTSAIGEGEGETSESIEENPLIQQTSAYQNDNIVYLSPDDWYLSEGGVQAFQTMMEEAASVLE